MNQLKRLLHENQGQDLIEYSLLLVIVAMASSFLLIGSGGSVTGTWIAGNSSFVNAKTSPS